MTYAAFWHDGPNVAAHISRQFVERAIHVHAAEYLDSHLFRANSCSAFSAAVSSSICKNQPFAFVGTSNVAGALRCAQSLVVLTGPCLVPRTDLRRIRALRHSAKDNDVLVRRIKEIVDGLPSFNSVFNIGAFLDPSDGREIDTIVIMETLEYTKLLLANDGAKYERDGAEILSSIVALARRTEFLIRQVHSSRRVRSRLHIVYSHEPGVRQIVDEIRCAAVFGNATLRESRYPRSLAPIEWIGLATEIYYTANFAREIQDQLSILGNPAIVMCESYTNFLPILSGFALPLEYFSIGRECHWLGLIPPPDLTGESDMHSGVPLHLGNKYMMETEIHSILRRNALGLLLSSLMVHEELAAWDSVSWAECVRSNDLDQGREYLVERLNGILC